MITTPADRAAQVRAEAEHLFGRSPFAEFFDWLEELVRTNLVEHEVDIRREYEDAE
jgi:hypothetical protein